jgi:hypothetical protein
MKPQEAIKAFAEVSAEVEKKFAMLSLEQLNFKPSPEKWSIAQCLDHLIVSNSTYYPPLNAVISGEHKNSFYQNIGFISRFFGNYLIKETGPVVAKSMKSPPAFVPSQSDLPITIVADFEKHQQTFTALILQLQNVDLHKTVIASPALAIITYNLSDLLTILAGHEQRHLNQAKNVLSHPSFPQ